MSTKIHNTNLSKLNVKVGTWTNEKGNTLYFNMRNIYFKIFFVSELIIIQVDICLVSAYDFTDIFEISGSNPLV